MKRKGRVRVGVWIRDGILRYRVPLRIGVRLVTDVKGRIRNILLS